MPGDGLAFRDFLSAKFPNVRNRCVGRAEFSKRSHAPISLPNPTPNPNPISIRNPNRNRNRNHNPNPNPNPYPNPYLTLALTLTLTLTLPTVRQDWVCEASDAIYPLFDAILQYTIETLVLDANILRDSILVRLEMVCTYVSTHPK